jgi:DNA polymerase-3 subunit chi
MAEGGAPVEVGFYHCTRQPAATVAVRLAERVLADRQRLLILGEAAVLDALDRALWTGDAAGFLPHGRADGEAGVDAADQPILLSDRADPVNGAALLMAVGTGVPPEFGRFSRILTLFDDGSSAHERARADWRALSDRPDVKCVYWQQSAKGWERRAL